MERAIQHAKLLDQEWSADLVLLLTEAAKIECTFCTGKGHHARTCASKKRLDRLYKRYGRKALWGSVKSRVIRDSIQRSIAVQPTGKALHKDAVAVIVQGNAQELG